MTSLIFAVILLVIAALAVTVRKSYFFLPTRELKRQAVHGDPLARKLYKAVSYGSSLRALLWLIIGLSSAGAFIILSHKANDIVALIVVVVVLGLIYSWLPAGRISSVGTRLTLLVTPAIVWLMNYLHPALGRAVGPIERRHAAGRHTGLFEREDLLDLLDKQGRQSDNRLTHDELDTAQRALNFNDHTIVDVMVPRKRVKTVGATSTVGPVLIDELHKLEQPFVLVAGNSKDDIIGILPTTRLGIKTTGQVRDHMDTAVYINEKGSLLNVLQAFRATGQSLFIVINDFEEFVGIVTVEAVIEELVGSLPEDDFDEYESVSAVAAHDPSPKLDAGIIEDAADEEPAAETVEDEASDEPENRVEEAGDDETDEPEVIVTETEEPLDNDEPESEAEDDSNDEADEQAVEEDTDDGAEKASDAEPAEADEVVETADDNEKSEDKEEASEDDQADEADAKDEDKSDEPEDSSNDDKDEDDDEESESADEPKPKPASKPVHISRKEKLDDPDFDSIEVSD